MATIEIRDAQGKIESVPLAGRLVLGTEHGFAGEALELVPRPEGAVVVPRSHAQVGSQRLAAGARRLVRPGERVEVEGRTVTLVPSPETAPETRLLARALLRNGPVPVRPGVPSLLWLNGPDLGRRVVLMEEATFIGRGDGCVAQVSDGQASRMHAKIVRGPDGFRLVDLMSANGVRVDGARLGEPRLLRGDEVIQVGGTLLAFEKPLEATRPAPKPVEVAKPVAQPVVEEAPQPKPVPRPKLMVGAEAAMLGLAVVALGVGGSVLTWVLR